MVQEDSFFTTHVNCKSLGFWLKPFLIYENLEEDFLALWLYGACFSSPEHNTVSQRCLKIGFENNEFCYFWGIEYYSPTWRSFNFSCPFIKSFHMGSFVGFQPFPRLKFDKLSAKWPARELKVSIFSRTDELMSCVGTAIRPPGDAGWTMLVLGGGIATGVDLVVLVINLMRGWNFMLTYTLFQGNLGLKSCNRKPNSRTLKTFTWRIL